MEEINRSIEVIRLSKEIMSLFRHNMAKLFEDRGITAPQGMLIGVLSKLGKMKISELSDKLSLSNSTVSGILDRLEKQGVVERERSKEDRRVVYVSLCAEFEEMHKDFRKKMDDNIKSMLNRGTPEEIEKIIEGFETLKRLLEDRKSNV